MPRIACPFVLAMPRIACLIYLLLPRILRGSEILSSKWIIGQILAFSQLVLQLPFL
ncbi:MAG: hypothetical protein ACTSQJ_12965 [Promethearchaeota archaeon]